MAVHPKGGAGAEDSLCLPQMSLHWATVRPPFVGVLLGGDLAATEAT